MENNGPQKPIYVTFSHPPSNEAPPRLFGFLWEMTKNLGFIAQHFNPVISIVSFFIATLVAHFYNLGSWSLAVGLAVAIPAWFVGGALIYWSIFSVFVGVIGFLIYLFLAYVTR